MNNIGIKEENITKNAINKIIVNSGIIIILVNIEIKLIWWKKYNNIGAVNIVTDKDNDICDIIYAFIFFDKNNTIFVINVFGGKVFIDNNSYIKL